MIWRYRLDNPTLGSAYVQDPIGWMDAQITLKRDETMHGVVPEYSVQSFGFTCAPGSDLESGYHFIKAVYDGQGIDARCGLLIEVDCDETDEFVEFFRGILNLSTVQFQQGENVAFCDVEADTPLQLVLNRIDVPVDLTKGTSIDGTVLPTYAKYPILIDIESGKTIKKRVVYDKEDVDDLLVVRDAGEVHFTCLDRDGTIWFSAGWPVLNNDFGTDANGGVARGITSGPIDACPSFPAGADYFSAPFSPPGLFTAPEDGNYCISPCEFTWSMSALVDGYPCAKSCGGTYDGYSDGYERISVRVGLFKNDDGTALVDLGFFDFTDGRSFADTGTQTTSFGGCYDLLAGDQLKLLFFVDFHATYENILFCGTSCLKHVASFTLHSPCCLTVELNSADFQAGATIQAFPPAELFDRVVRSITDNEIGVFTDYFGRTDAQPLASAVEGCGARQTITSGFLIRQFPVETNGVAPGLGDCVADAVDAGTLTVFNPGVYASLKELFEGYDAINNLGMGLATLLNHESAIRVEAKEFFYQDVVVLTIPNVDKVAKHFQREALAERYWNEAEIGYADWQRETVNGLDEFNTLRQYVTPLKKIRNKFSQVCQFIASGYTFETLRRMPFTKTSSQGSPRNRDGSSYDENLFVVCVDEVLPTSQIEQGGVGLTNVLYPAETYNWRISPYYNMRRWMGWIGQASLPNKMWLPFWKFSKGDGNVKASGAENVQGLGCEFGAHVEDDTLTSEQGRTPIFVKPERLTVGLRLSLSQFYAIQANPYGLIRLEFGDGTYEDAYLQEMAYKPSTSETNLQLIPKIV